MRTTSLVSLLCLLAVVAPARGSAQRPARTAHAATREAEATARPVAPPGRAKDGTTATLLGIVFPGAGHYYAGEPGRGALITAGALVLGSAGMAGFGDDADHCGESVLVSGGRTSDCEPSGAALVMFVAGLGVWTYGAIDAHLAARRENERHGLAALPRRLTPAVASDGGTVRVSLRLALGGGGVR